MKKPKFSNRAILYAENGSMLFRRIAILRLSELPENAEPFPFHPRRYFLRRKPAPLVPLENSPRACNGRQKVKPRPGVHLHHMTPEDVRWWRGRRAPWKLVFREKNHSVGKVSAHRAERRKTKVYFAGVDPDGDYDARLRFGLNERSYS